MNKKELVVKIASETGFTQKDVEEIVGKTFDTIAEVLAEHGEVSITGLGKFIVKETAARTGRNPSTGAEIQIPSSHAVKFKVSEPLKRAVKGE